MAQLMMRNIFLLKVMKSLRSAMFFIPVAVPYFLSKGINMQEFMLTQAIFAAALLVLEIPSGYISDRWKRKTVLLLGSLLWVVGIALLLVAHDFVGLVTSEVVAAIGLSLISGTDSALLYDSLLAAGREKEYKKQEGIITASGLWVIGLSSLVSGVLYTIYPHLPVILTVAFGIICLIPVLMLKEPPRHKKQNVTSPLKDMAKVTKYAMHGHPEIKWIILFASMLFGTTLLGAWFRQPYYGDYGISIEMFGVLEAICFFIAATSSQLAHWVEDKFGTKHSVYILAICAVLPFAVIAVDTWLIGVISLVLFSVAYGMGDPIIKDAINSRVSSDIRATVLSVEQTPRRLVFIILAPFVGAMMDSSGIAAAAVMSLVVCGGVIAISLWGLRKAKLI